jgi:hypothetical protein
MGALSFPKISSAQLSTLAGTGVASLRRRERQLEPDLVQI